MSDPSPRWPHGARAAVSLSYDDAMPCHRTLVAPVLERYGFRGTFYAPFRADLVEHTEAWRDIARRGHELGNHSLFHPCRAVPPESKSWVAPWNNLVDFGPDRFRNELAAANFMLHLLDGRDEHTYGNTCHDVLIGPPEAPQRIEPILAELFVAGRGRATGQPTGPDTADLFDLGTTGGDGKGCAQWQAHVEEALDTGGYLLITFHGVGPKLSRLHVAERDHEQFLAWLRSRADDIWTAPVIEVAGHIREHQQRLAAGA